MAPELQILHETSAAGYVNFMRDTIDWGVGWDLINSRNDLFPDYSAYLALAEQPSALIDKVADKLLYETMPADLKTEIQTALDSIVIPAPDASGSNILDRHPEASPREGGDLPDGGVAGIPGAEVT